MKILIGYDGSDDADEALEDLSLAGLPIKADVTVLTVAVPWAFTELGSGPGNAFGTSAFSVADARAFNEQAKANAQVLAGRARRRLEERRPQWKIRHMTALDYPAPGILAKSEEWKPDLIVLGSHGHTALGRLLLGSVSHKVLHHCHASVRINRARVRSEKIPPRLLVGMDGSPDSDAAVREVLARDWPEGTKVRLLAVFDNGIILEKTLGKTSGKGLEQFQDAKSVWLEHKMAEAAEKISAKGLRVYTKILDGDARHVLLKKAADWRVDCIFLGSRGMNGLKRFLLGSVSSAVASHAPCTVEVIRGK